MATPASSTITASGAATSIATYPAATSPGAPLPQPVTSSPDVIYIDPTLDYAINWTITGIALCFVLLRLYVRAIHLKRFRMDDVFVIMATAFQLTGTIIMTVIHPRLYPYTTVNTLMGNGIFYLQWQVNLAYWAPLLPDYQKLTQLVLTSTIMFAASLWCIKASFLMFYRQIFLAGNHAPSKRFVWWGITFFVAASFAVCLSLPISACPSSAYGSCLNEHSNTLILAGLWVITATDIASDLMLLSFSIWLLWRVKIQTREKLALMGLFSLTFVIIAFAIVRASVTFGQTGIQQTLWIGLWSCVENCVSLIVVSTVALRPLFTKAKQATSSAFGSSRGKNGTGFSSERPTISSPMNVSFDEKSMHRIMGSKSTLNSPTKPGMELNSFAVSEFRMNERGLWSYEDQTKSRSAV